MKKKIVIARIQVIEGKEEACLSFALSLIEAVKAEPGNIVYTMYQGTQKSSEFIVYEEYINEEAFIEHCNTDHFQFFGQQIKPFLAKEIDIQVF